jgi:uridylate kinase
MLFTESTGGLNTQYVRKFIDALVPIHESGLPVAVVVGGGRIAGEYTRAVRELGGNEFYADKLAIDGTRLNALYLISGLGKSAYPKVITDLDDAFHAMEEGLIPVGGGLIEGFTTDTVSVLFAERLKACRVVNVSSVDYVYDSDPRTNPKAKRFDSMTHQQLMDLANASDSRKARTNFVFDLIACKLAARSNIPIHFVGGKNIAEVTSAIQGKTHKGTVVSG